MFRDLKNIEVPRVVTTQRYGQITITYLTVWVILREQGHQITDTMYHLPHCLSHPERTGTPDHCHYVSLTSLSESSWENSDTRSLTLCITYLTVWVILREQGHLITDTVYHLPHCLSHPERTVTPDHWHCVSLTSLSESSWENRDTRSLTLCITYLTVWVILREQGHLITDTVYHLPHCLSHPERTVTPDHWHYVSLTSLSESSWENRDTRSLPLCITYLTVWVILREQWHQITDTMHHLPHCLSHPERTGTLDHWHCVSLTSLSESSWENRDTWSLTLCITYLTVWVILREQRHQITDTVYHLPHCLSHPERTVTLDHWHCVSLTSLSESSWENSDTRSLTLCSP